MAVPRDWCLVELAPVVVVVDGGGAGMAVPRDWGLGAEVAVVDGGGAGLAVPRDWCLVELALGAVSIDPKASMAIPGDVR